MKRIEDGHRLAASDHCYYLEEYIAGKDYRAGDTNQFISNFKVNLALKPQREYFKTKAIASAVSMLAAHLSRANTADVTFVPMPGSKPIGHPRYDDRMIRVIRGLASRIGPTFDGRPVLITTHERVAQHEGVPGEHRVSIEDLVASMGIDQTFLATPLRSKVTVIDDVFTLGTSFKAAQRLLMQLPGVTEVSGLFLARTVWQPEDGEDDIDLSEFLASIE